MSGKATADFIYSIILLLWVEGQTTDFIGLFQTMLLSFCNFNYDTYNYASQSTG